LAVRRFEERTDPTTGEPYLAVTVRGADLKDDPLLNKGTCFTEAERDALGLHGLLPASVQTPDEQLARAYGNYLKAGNDVRRYLFLAGLQDRNETLFCRLLLDHLEEMVPVIYTPTVGKACQQYSHIYRRARGLYVSPDDRGRLPALLRNAVCTDPRVIVITDNEAILGIGDQGVGGMPIAIGKLALYTAGAGIHPAQCLPIDLDVGTDNPALLADPLYLGVHRQRLRGDPYFAVLDELVDAIADLFPRALVQWEDFASRNAFAVLARYRQRVLSFNDDIQGTGAVTVAGIRSALTQVGRALDDERIVFFGAGASGAGSALAVRAALLEAGVPASDLPRRVLCLDSRGLIVADRPGLDGPKREIAADPALVAGWPRPSHGVWTLDDVVRHFKPTVLVGASGQPGVFTEAIVRDLLAGCRRPIILALSNPTDRVEATPAELIEWTHGAAIVGTGSPFAPVHHGGRSYTIGQGNNALIFPGVGLGATAVQARWLPDVAFSAAAKALVDVTAASSPGHAIYPPLSRLREVSRAVAAAVGRALVDAGAAPPLSRDEVERRVLAGMWMPHYLPYRAADPSVASQEAVAPSSDRVPARVAGAPAPVIARRAPLSETRR
jgi:malate dehydrogenase (oxaloacetate-decarboxylating)